MLTIDEAIHRLRADPRAAELVRDAYFDRDVAASGERFLHSAEFEQVRQILGARLHGAVVADIGAGTGIASYAFAKSGAKQVYAVEPDPSDEVGRGAIQRIRADLPIAIVDAVGESLPLDSASVDLVYARQVLHHIGDLPTALRQFARLLKPGGMFIACREHVVDNAQQLSEFLHNHPMHQLAGGENAYPLDAYVAAIKGSGLTDLRCIAPWESVINAYPTVRSQAELEGYARRQLRAKLGALGALAAAIPGVEGLVWQRIKRPAAGRMYTFVAVKG